MKPEILGLRTWRLRKGVTLERISASTKLSIGQLEAIECGDFRKLPGGIYNTNYLRQYAQAIEFDEFELISFYKTTFAAPAKEEPSQKTSSARLSRLLLEH